MHIFSLFADILMRVLYFFYDLLWSDLFTIPLPGGSELGVSLLVALLIPAGLWLTLRTRFVQVRLFGEMLHIALRDPARGQDGRISGFQALVISTATRIGMGNLVGVVAAISLGGAGAVFWMWVSALIGMATAFVEATLAQLYQQEDPLYGGLRGGPAYYIHAWAARKRNRDPRTLRRSVLAVLFAVSGLICWCGISQVVGNSVSSAVFNAFRIPPMFTAIVLTGISAVIVLRKNATVKVLDAVVPVMAGCFFAATIIVIAMNLERVPEVFHMIFAEAFGLRPMAAGGLGAVIMNGVKRGLFSNEAGSGSAPCAAAAACVDHPAKEGLLQAFGVFIDTMIICTCSALLMLLAPADVISGLEGMDLLQAAARWHFGEAGVIFIAVSLLLFSFSTFIGILFYARPNVAYLFGDRWGRQTAYKLLALAMLFIGCIAAYTFVWDLGDVGVGLMTVFNLIALLPLSKEAVASLKDYESRIARRKAKDPSTVPVGMEL